MALITLTPMHQLSNGQQSALPLILAMLWNWETVQIEYTNAFAQVTLDEEIYMGMPCDFIPKNSNLNLILKLNKSLYGLKQAPLSWFEHLKTHLEQ